MKEAAPPGSPSRRCWNSDDLTAHSYSCGHQDVLSPVIDYCKEGSLWVLTAERRRRVSNEALLEVDVTEAQSRTTKTWSWGRPWGSASTTVRAGGGEDRIWLDQCLTAGFPSFYPSETEEMNINSRARWISVFDVGMYGC